MIRRHMIEAVAAAAALLAALTPAAGAAGYENKVNKQSPDVQSELGDDADQAVLNLNSATKDELKTLPALGEEFAERIIEYRPYKTKEDLRRRHIVPGDVYDQIKHRVTTYPEQARPVETDVTR